MEIFVFERKEGRKFWRFLVLDGIFFFIYDFLNRDGEWELEVRINLENRYNECEIVVGEKENESYLGMKKDWLRVRLGLDYINV